MSSEMQESRGISHIMVENHFPLTTISRCPSASWEMLSSLGLKR